VWCTEKEDEWYSEEVVPNMAVYTALRIKEDRIS
jgi:hypothetical protein